MKEPANKQKIELVNRLDSYRNIIGIVNLLGLIGLVFEIVTEGISADTVVWAVAFSIGLLYWTKSKIFLSSSTDEEAFSSELEALKRYSMIFLIAWIMGAVLTLALWGEPSVTTGIGILLMLVATFMMNKFQGDVKLLMLEG